MAKAKKKTRSKAGTKRKTSNAAPLRERIASAWGVVRATGVAAFRGMVAIAWVGVITTLAIMWSPLKERVAQARSVQPTIEIDWPGAPGAEHAGDGSLVRLVHSYLTREVEAIAGDSPFDRAGLAAARERLLDSGWFASIDSIAREPDGRIVVTGTHRREAVLADHAGEVMVVAHDGVPLELPPGVSAPDGLFMVVGVPRGPARTADGEIDRRAPWRIGGVPAAIDLLELVAQLPPEINGAIDGVDLSRLDDDGMLLVTNRGGWLRWGGDVGEPEPGEVDDARKLSNIVRVLSPRERLDRPDGLIDISIAQPRIDLSFPRPPR